MQNDDEEMCECGQEKKKTSIRRRRGLLQGYHEYEHWLHHAIITKLPAVPWRMRGLDWADSTHLNRWPLPPTALRLSTYESCAAKDHLTITPVSMTQDQGGCREKEQREGKKVSCIWPAKWFEVMFDNELWVCEMCRGWICIYRFTTFEYFGLWGPPDAEQFLRGKNAAVDNILRENLL